MHAIGSSTERDFLLSIRARRARSGFAQRIGRHSELSFSLRYYAVEPVAAARNRMDEPLPCCIVIDGAPRRTDSAGNRGIRNDAAIPDSFDQVVLGNHPAGMADEVEQQIEDLRFYVCGRGAVPQFPP